MSEQVIESSEHLERVEAVNRPSVSSFGLDLAMARIWIELFTRATLYAGAFGLIVGMVAALFLGD